LGEIGSRIPSGGIEQLYFFVGVVLMLVGFGYKVSLVPFHMWTPDVYEGAPTAITAYMSVGSKVAGFVAIIALTQMMQAAVGTLQPLLMGIAVLTMLVGSIVAISQTSVKRMLAYSSIGHAGFIMLGVLTNAMGQGLMAPIFYMVAYTVTNLAAFGVVMVVERADGHDLQIGDLAGLWERNPWLTVVMALALLSLAGVPPTVGFLAKFQILSAVWSAGSMWLALAAALASAIGAFFYVRTFIQLFSGESTTAAERPAASTTVALAIVGLAIVVLGILPWTVTSVALAGS
jgi:NADH-quinone oxidoreductase subunit N